MAKLKCPYCDKIPKYEFLQNKYKHTYQCLCQIAHAETKKQAGYFWNKWVGEELKILQHKASENQGKLF